MRLLLLSTLPLGLANHYCGAFTTGCLYTKLTLLHHHQSIRFAGYHSVTLGLWGATARTKIPPISFSTSTIKSTNNEHVKEQAPTILSLHPYVGCDGCRLSLALSLRRPSFRWMRVQTLSRRPSFRWMRVQTLSLSLNLNLLV